MNKSLMRDIDLTYQDYLLTPEGKRYELVEGDLLMTPSPGFSHQGAIKELQKLLDRHVEENDLGVVVQSPYDVILSDTNVFVPDLIFVTKERRAMLEDRGIFGPPDLIVEILSPSSIERDRITKRRLYYKYGVREYWIVDPVARTVEVCRPGARAFDTHKIFTVDEDLGSPLLPEFAPAVKSFFRE